MSHNTSPSEKPNLSQNSLSLHYPDARHFILGSALAHRETAEEFGGIYFRWRVMSYFMGHLLTPVFWMPEFLNEEFFLDPEEFTRTRLLPFGISSVLKQKSPLVARIPPIGILQIDWIINYLGWQDCLRNDAILSETKSQDTQFRCHVPPEFDEFRPRHDDLVWEREREGREWLEEAVRKGIKVTDRMDAEYQILPKFR